VLAFGVVLGIEESRAIRSTCGLAFAWAIGKSGGRPGFYIGAGDIRQTFVSAGPISYSSATTWCQFTVEPRIGR